MNAVLNWWQRWISDAFLNDDALRKRMDERRHGMAPEMRFIYSKKGRIVGVRCDCGWVHQGAGGATVNAAQWGTHYDKEHTTEEADDA